MPPGLAAVNLGTSQSKQSLVNDIPLVNSDVGRSHYSFVLDVTDVEWDCINTRCASLFCNIIAKTVGIRLGFGFETNVCLLARKLRLRKDLSTAKMTTAVRVKTPDRCIRILEQAFVTLVGAGRMFRRASWQESS